MKVFDHDAFKDLSPLLMEAGNMSVKEEDGELYLLFSDEIEKHLTEREYDHESFVAYMTQVIIDALERDLKNDLPKDD